MSRLPRFAFISGRALVIGFSLVGCATALPASAEVPCEHAHRQVHAYMSRMKAFADAEAYRNIPLRCGPDWHCGNWWIGRLNFWYGQQVARARAMHAHIEQQCALASSRPLPTEQPRRPEPPPTAAGRTVAIEIPTTPEGYRP